jgi:hypothetical protein
MQSFHAVSDTEGELTMGIQPLQDWTLIEPSEAKGKTTGVVHPRHGQGERVEGKAVGERRWETLNRRS